VTVKNRIPTCVKRNGLVDPATDSMDPVGVLIEPLLDIGANVQRLGRDGQVREAAGDSGASGDDSHAARSGLGGVRLSGRADIPHREFVAALFSRPVDLGNFKYGHKPLCRVLELPGSGNHEWNRCGDILAFTNVGTDPLAAICRDWVVIAGLGRHICGFRWFDPAISLESP
jgi:hypothetical protein